MSNVYLFLADNFEEIEAVTTLDILRRAGIDILSVSVTGSEYVTGSHKITIKTDILFEDIKSAADMMILPGGPGHTALLKHKGLITLLRKQYDENKFIAAICAAPSVLGQIGLLKGKKAVCYPSYEPKLVGAEIIDNPVVSDGNIITSKGPGTTVNFALKIVETLVGRGVMEKIKKDAIIDLDN